MNSVLTSSVLIYFVLLCLAPTSEIVDFAGVPVLPIHIADILGSLLYSIVVEVSVGNLLYFLRTCRCRTLMYFHSHVLRREDLFES